MSETADFAFKALEAEAIPAALDKARHYRLLNEPSLAQSICLDVLATDPENQEALVVIVLAETDLFSDERATARPRSARAYLTRIIDPFQRAYYAGLISEREARAFLGRGHARAFAYDCFREAMEWYEKAEALSDSPHPALRWNSCLRAIRREKLKPRPPERELPLE